VPASPDLERAIDAIAAEWRTQRGDRLARRSLDRADFDRLRDAGLLTAVVPVESGGRWHDATSVRPLCDLYRRLGAVDPSVALVSSMHPAVIAFWLASPDASNAAWNEQRDAVFAGAMAGEQWGTITSEPGSGGDIARTRAVATPGGGAAFLPGSAYTVTGDKHFGSGSGITDRMMTTAVPAGEEGPTIFVLDVRGEAFDGTTGMQLVAEWDGVGMAATQSHSIRLEDKASIRLAWDGPFEAITFAAAPLVSALFIAVVLGVFDEAVATARDQLAGRRDQLRPYEQVEWARAEQEHWVATQLYEGGLRSIAAGDPEVAFHDLLRAKQAVAHLAERSLLRISRVVGGGTFSARSPFAHWYEDVRALGFLRPPWGLAADLLYGTSF
jgi:alkylation response protein AidB-like acyl-CoA dehydrogenase